MAKIKPGLGRGIGTLIPTGLESEKTDGRTLKLSQIEPNRNQPRKKFDEEGLKNLAESMKKYGVIQPIVVCKQNDYYEIVAGERRWRAAQKAGLKEIPVVICEYSSQERMEIALIENIQRQDLNPIEEARGFKVLIDEYGLTQEDLAERVFKSRASVANSLRLLRLPEEVQGFLADGKLSSGHARALLALKNNADITDASKKVIDEDLSVRQTEALVKRLADNKPEKKDKKTQKNDVNYSKLERDMSEALGARVCIRQTGSNAGKIEISYATPEDLDRLYGIINSKLR